MLKSVNLGAVNLAISLSDALAAFMLLVPTELRLCEVVGPGTQAADTSIIGLILLAGGTVRVPLDSKAVTLCPHVSGPANKERS